MKWVILVLMFLVLAVSVEASIDVISPVSAARLMDNNVSFQFNSSVLTNCSYSIDGYAYETCTFNTSFYDVASIGWNTLDVCGYNASGRYCLDENASLHNFWCDKQDKTVADMFPLLLLLFAGLTLGAFGIFKYGFMGVLGGLCLFVACIESYALGLNVLCYALFFMAVLVLLGGFRDAAT